MIRKITTHKPHYSGQYEAETRVYFLGLLIFKFTVQKTD